MIIDKKGKILGKVSIIDLLIIVVIIGGILGLGYKYSSNNILTPLSQKDDFSIEFYCDEAPDYAVKAIKVGDKAFDYERSSFFGLVEEIKSDKSKTFTQTSDGKFVISPKEGYKSAIIKVKSEGIINPNGGVTIDNIDYFVGRSIVFRAGDAVVYSRVYKIDDPKK